MAFYFKTKILSHFTNNHSDHNKVDIVPVQVTNMNGYFTGTSPSFAGLSNKSVVPRRARVGMHPICPEYSTLGYASSRFPQAFNFRGREK